MPLARIGKFNYLVKLMLLLAAIFILVLAVFLLVNSFPESLGTPPPAYQIKKSYEFEPWAFSFHDLHVSFPEGGTIVPVYEQEKQKAALILGRGIYENQNSPENLKMQDIDENLNLPEDVEYLPEDLQKMCIRDRSSPTCSLNCNWVRTGITVTAIFSPPL